jgi:hypothetical protein
MVFVGVIAGAHHDVHPGCPSDLLQAPWISADTDRSLVHETFPAVALEKISFMNDFFDIVNLIGTVIEPVPCHICTVG